MKIGIVCYPTFGGSGVVATELGKALAANNHEVHFITYSQPVRLEGFNTKIYYHEVEAASYPLFQHSPYETALASKMVDVVRHENLDLLHVHYAIPHASAAYMARQILKKAGYNIPVITTLHGTDITLVGRNPSYEPVVTFSINESNAVTAVSESLRQDTLNHFDIERDIEVIPNFIDTNRFKRINKEGFRSSIAPKGEKILVHTSNFRKVKRVDDVMHIFSKVCEVVPARLLMVGDGPERNSAERLCRSLGTCGRVRFLGKVDAVEEVLSVADLFLMPSEKESFGLAALEAMACGVPVISSNTGGLPELNINGQTGYLSDVGDVDSMSKQAITVLDKQNLTGFKERAYQKALEFDISNIVPMYEKLYEKLHREALTLK